MRHLSWRSYHIQFTGNVTLDRPLLPAQVAYLQRFLSTRRVGWRMEQIQEMTDPVREAVGLPLETEGAYFTGLSYHELDLIYGTRWNRLDIADLRTGERLSDRSFDVAPGEKYPDHYLDYFHGRLSVSPDQQWLVDDGWMWHPVGSVVAWNLQRWLYENPWESEDGLSMLELCNRTYYWDGPLCWINERVVAVWGYGDDEEDLIPAVRLFDVVAEKELDWFAGPEGTLVYDGYLFALSEEHGLTAWDIVTGERVLVDPDFHPTRYHRGAKQFLHIDLQKGAFQVGALVQYGSSVQTARESANAAFPTREPVCQSDNHVLAQNAGHNSERSGRHRLLDLLSTQTNSPVDRALCWSHEIVPPAGRSPPTSELV